MSTEMAPPRERGCTRLEENLVFAFELTQPDRTVFATPGSKQSYAPYAASFDDLVAQMIDAAAEQRASLQPAPRAR